MQRIILIACLAFALQACARSSADAPSHLGLPMLSDEESLQLGETADPNDRPELRHVTSNKVLGAMAFQKTTGQTVDPERLRGSR